LDERSAIAASLEWLDASDYHSLFEHTMNEPMTTPQM